MDCRASPALMASALDEADSALRAEIEQHAVECPECAEAWHRLEAVDSLLLSAAMADVPAGFVDRTVLRLTSIERAGLQPDLSWSDAALIVAGGVAVASLMAFWVRSPAVQAVPDLHVVSVAVQALLGIASAAAVEPVTAVLMQACLALGVAALWFAAVVAPRSAALRRSS